LHEEEEREEGDRGEQEEKKGDSRGERQIYAVLCSQSVLRSPDTHRDSQNWIGKRRVREEIESAYTERQCFVCSKCGGKLKYRSSFIVHQKVHT
ncbi:unnamed protein product, partial [Rangifer tarandus platyrhynchus]